jgi:selenocysteine lyase/cysteine desulfurase
LIASLDLLLGWGVARIAASLSALNARLAEQFQARGFTVPAPAARSPHFFGVGLPPGAPKDLAARLAQEGVYLSVRSGKMRVSPHLWIDGEDEARLIAALDRHLG